MGLLEMSLHLSVRVALTWEGGMVYHLFQKTEEILKRRAFRSSLKFVAPKSRVKLYRDMIDFLFCELVPGFHEDCMRFYDEGRPLLCETIPISPALIVEWDNLLVAALHVARRAKERNREMKWENFRRASQREARRKEAARVLSPHIA